MNAPSTTPLGRLGEVWTGKDRPVENLSIFDPLSRPFGRCLRCRSPLVTMLEDGAPPPGFTPIQPTIISVLFCT